MDKLKITKRQKKIISIFATVALIFIVFFLFMYLPSRSELIKLKREVYSLESEIHQIRQATGEGKTLEAGIIILKEKLDSLDRKFPSHEEVILKELSSMLKDLGIEVVSLSPQRKRFIDQIDGVAIKIKDSSLQEMPISLHVRSDYKTLAEFFRKLKKDSPVFIRVDNVHIVKHSIVKHAILDVNMSLNSYLVIPQSAVE